MAAKKKAEAVEKLTEQSSIKLVPMIREDGNTADVHPREVENYRAGGYEIVK